MGAREMRDEALHRIGEVMMSPTLAEPLGIEANRRRGMWMGMTIGAMIGVVVGYFLGRSRAREEFWDQPQEHVPPIGRGQIDVTDAADQSKSQSKEKLPAM